MDHEAPPGGSSNRCSHPGSAVGSAVAPRPRRARPDPGRRSKSLSRLQQRGDRRVHDASRPGAVVPPRSSSKTNRSLRAPDPFGQSCAGGHGEGGEPTFSSCRHRHWPGPGHRRRHGHDATDLTRSLMPSRRSRAPHTIPRVARPPTRLFIWDQLLNSSAPEELPV